MADQPPQTELSKIEGEAKKLFSFTMSHLVLVVIIVALAVAGFYLWADRVAVQADAKAALSEEKAQDADKRAADATVLNVQLQQRLDTEIKAAQADRAQQAQFQQTIIDQLKQRQAQVVTLAPPDLAILHGQLVGMPGPTVQGDGFLSSLPLEQKTVQMLEEVPSLTMQLASKDKQLSDADAVISKGQDQLSGEKNSHTLDNEACVADKKALNDEIAKVKADARKSKFKWAAGGAIILEILRIAFTRKL